MGQTRIHTICSTGHVCRPHFILRMTTVGSDYQWWLAIQDRRKSEVYLSDDRLIRGIRTDTLETLASAGRKFGLPLKLEAMYLR